MNNLKRAVQLLLVEDSQNKAEHIANLFRTQGRSVRVRRVDNKDELEQALQQSWDLLICAPACQQISAEQVAQVLTKRSRDIPLIQLLDKDNYHSPAIVAAMRRGARTVLPCKEDERLLLAAQRELASLEDRRALHAALAAQQEAEKRCQLHHSWLQRFGYKSAEELEGIPIIDLIAASEQSKFKAFIKEGKAEQQEGAQLTLTAVSQSGQSFAAKMVFSPASYQGESCTQVIIRREQNNAALEEKLREISSRDLTTGLYNHSHFLTLVDEAAAMVEDSGALAAVAYMRIDHYSDLLANIGLSGVEHLVIALGELLRAHFSDEVQLARFADNAFSLLQTGTSAVQLEKNLKRLRKEVASRLFDIGGRTIQTSLSVGLVGLEKGASLAEQVIEQARQCATEAAQGNGLKRFDAAEQLAAQANSGDIAALLKQALSTDGFRLLFQPVVHLRGEPEEHYEVLLRLKTQEGKEIAPPDFLQVAEREGLLCKIDRWVILNAIKRQHSSKNSPRLLIHLSSASLQDESLLPWLASLIKAAKLPASRLTFQLNAKEAEQWVKQSKQLIEGLHKLRCQAALSQFDGTARQFALLNHLPAYFIKLDSHLSQNLDEPDNQERLKTLLDKLAALDKQTIVPFVETVGVLSLLWQAGANYIQGYYLQAPSSNMNYDFTSN